MQARDRFTICVAALLACRGTAYVDPARASAPASAAVRAGPEVSGADGGDDAGENGKGLRAAPSSRAFARRCGWIDNPTPANVWLVDRDGEWEIGIQGGHQADGEMPDFGAAWVETNGYHGYGCACIRAIADEADHRILEYRDVEVLPLARCRTDPRLPRR
ncbi:MAG: DUF4087 domain-containing protein [Polyangiaceae bacterium]|nr:DUF4087 domain-containing protein [Polyangiaceae bacterium]